MPSHTAWHTASTLAYIVQASEVVGWSITRPLYLFSLVQRFQLILNIHITQGLSTVLVLYPSFSYPTCFWGWNLALELPKMSLKILECTARMKLYLMILQNNPINNGHIQLFSVKYFHFNIQLSVFTTPYNYFLYSSSFQEATVHHCVLFIFYLKR